jgi:agmatine deiminase
MSMCSDVDKNLKKAAVQIEKAANHGANIVCLPELFTTTYFPQEHRKNTEHAEDIPGKTTDILRQMASENKVIVVGGSIYEKENEKCFNTVVVVDDNGTILGKYRKIHLPHDQNFYEQDYFSKGNLGFRVFRTKYGNLAPLICYDQWYPEAARIVSLMGADIIIYPTAIGYVDDIQQTEGDWKDAWTTVQRGHAIANSVVVAAVNRVGKEGKMQFWGGSFVTSQFGKILGKAGSSEEIINATVDLELGKEVKEGWRFFYNRRPETYGRIVEKG